MIATVAALVCGHDAETNAQNETLQSASAAPRELNPVMRSLGRAIAVGLSFGGALQGPVSHAVFCPFTAPEFETKVPLIP
jgi:hypothetical protein